MRNRRPITGATGRANQLSGVAGRNSLAFASRKAPVAKAPNGTTGLSGTGHPRLEVGRVHGSRALGSVRGQEITRPRPGL
jgi:hypothetical protein